MKRAVIIGAGIGGLATSIILAKAGYTVAIYEKQARAGGRAGQLEIDGFTFDTGPSWYLMPEVFENFFKLIGEDITEHIRLTKLDTAYKVYFEHDDPIRVTASQAENTVTFDAVEAGAGERLNDYLRDSQITYQAALNNFLYTNFDAPLKLLKPEVVRLLPSLARAACTSIDTHVSKYFTDRRLKQIMEYPMVFLGTSPYEAPALYSLMSHMDFSQGVFYPERGLYAVIEALESIAAKAGVTRIYNSPVKRITTKNGSATGIELVTGDVITADIVVSNADLHFSETELLQPSEQTYPESYWQKKQAGPSALLMYLGVKGKLPQLDHHNLLFVDDWRKNFDEIFIKKDWPTPASIYICKPSQTDTSVAPSGHENVFILVPAPATLGTGRAELEQLADTYLAQIAVMTGIGDLQDRIVVRHIVGPDDFANDFNSWQGTALGLSHKLTQSALFRPSNKSKKVSNVYYVGGNTMPGIGLPMCLISAELMYKRLINDTSSASLADQGIQAV